MLELPNRNLLSLSTLSELHWWKQRWKYRKDGYIQKLSILLVVKVGEDIENTKSLLDWFATFVVQLDIFIEFGLNVNVPGLKSPH